MPTSQTRTKARTTSSISMTRSSSTSSKFFATSSSNIASPTSLGGKGGRSRKMGAAGVVGTFGVLLAIGVVTVMVIVWRRHRRYQALKARMLASSQNAVPQRSMALETLGTFRTSPYISLNRRENDPSESSAQLVQREENQHGRGGTEDTEPDGRRKSYQPSSGYSYPGER